MLSLCIPTMDRFDTFLKKNLDRYLLDPLIDEIIITDENGNDFEKITKNYNNDKIKVFKNDRQLGPFMNKLKCCKMAKNEWIMLIDSDNYADQTYSKTVMNYIETNKPTKQSVLSPVFGSSVFDYRSINPKIMTRNNIKNTNNFPLLTTVMNTGNYVINKHLIDNINIDKEHENIKKSSSCDVIFFNTLLFEQFDLVFHMVSNLNYEHVVHDNSIYLQTCGKYRDFNNQIENRFRSLK